MDLAVRIGGNLVFFKHLQRFLCFTVFVVVSLFSVFATEDLSVDDSDPSDAVVIVDVPVIPDSQTVVQPIVVQVDTSGFDGIASIIGDLLSESDFLDGGEGEVDLDYGGLELVDVMAYPVSPLYELDNGSSTAVTGLKKIIRGLIGDYNPVVVQFRYQANGSSSYSYVNQVQLDYEWLCSCGIFALMLFCTFRLGGGLLRRV